MSHRPHASATSARSTVANTLKRLLCGAGSAERFDHLEQRQLLSVSVVTAIEDQTVARNSPGTVIQLANRFDDTSITGRVARFQTVFGDVFAKLFDQQTPQTVENFRRYVDGNLYRNSIIHRSVPGFVVQGGGFTMPNFNSIASFPPVLNEPGISNRRGTIAMAKLGGNPNSATSQWFFNLADNSGNLDNQNGGFTVFGEVVGNGMTVIDNIAALQRFNFGGAFNELPVRNYTQADFNAGRTPTADNTVNFTNISFVPELTFTVTSANPNLVTATIVDGNRLSLSYAANATGETNVTVRATSVTGQFIEDTFSVRVALVPPTVGSVSARPATVVTPGVPVDLNVSNIVDRDSSIDRVQYWLDANANGTFDDASDTLLGETSNASGGYRFTFSTNNLAVGTYRVFARVKDSDNLFSNVVTTTFRINAAPTSTEVTGNPSPVERLAQVTLRTTAADTDGTIRSVIFWLDANNDGIFTESADRRLGAGRFVNNGWELTTSTRGFLNGENRIFAVAEDNDRARGTPSQGAVTVTNAIPTASALRARPGVIANSGDPVTLSIGGQRDRDGQIVSVDYYLDVDNSGTLNDGDINLGQSTNPSGGFAFVASTAGLLPATYRYLAILNDNDGGRSAPVSTTIRVNALPTIAAAAANPDPVERLSQVTLVATGVADDGRVRRVEFWRDVDNDGTLNILVDRRLGNARSVSPDGWELRTNTRGFATGENRFFVRAEDNDRGLSQVFTFTAVVTNALPQINTVIARPAVIVNPGDTINLRSTGIRDRDGSIIAVEYYRDADGSGTLTPEDNLIGTATTSAGSWGISLATEGFLAGVNRVFARAQDNDGGYSPVVTTTFFINTAPTVTSFIALPDPIIRTGSFQIQSVAADIDGSIRRLEFFLDTNNDGIFTRGTDRSLGTGAFTVDRWSRTVNGSALALGQNRLFAIATDNTGAASGVSSLIVNVV